MHNAFWILLWLQPQQKRPLWMALFESCQFLKSKHPPAQKLSPLDHPSVLDRFNTQGTLEMFPHSQLRRTGWTRRPAKGCPVTHTVRVNKAPLCVPALLWDQAANNTLNGPYTLWLLQTGCLQSELGLSTERPLWNLFPVAPQPEKKMLHI